MTILIVGASGSTGRLLVKQLLDRGMKVRIIVRSTDQLSETLLNDDNLSVIEASVLDLDDATLSQHALDCDAVASCLGHNLTFKGMFGQPRLLVTDVARRLCEAIMENSPVRPVKFVLMNTTGNRNRDLDEPISLAQKAVMALIRFLIPPHVDNEKAADHLRREIGQDNHSVEWAVVRPDSLIDEDEATGYDIHPSPIRSAIFDSGKTSRINVGHFMAELITDDSLWKKWKGQMPVIYNQSQP